MITNLELSIKNKLQTLDKLAFIYDYFTLETEWYPYVSFELSDFDWEFLDVCTNQRQFIFNLVIIQEINKNLTRSQAKNILYDILEDLILAFDWQMDLWNGNIVKWNLSKWQMGTFLEKEGSILALNVELKLETLINAW